MYGNVMGIRPSRQKNYINFGSGGPILWEFYGNPAEPAQKLQTFGICARGPLRGLLHGRQPFPLSRLTIRAVVCFRWKIGVKYGFTRPYSAAKVFVACATSLAAAVTSWSEFRSLNAKLERYNFVIREVRNLNTWWAALGDVNRAEFITFPGMGDYVLGVIKQWRARPLLYLCPFLPTRCNESFVVLLRIC